MKVNNIVIKEFKISEIVPYWNNPRINGEAIEVVKESIEEYGYVQPLVIDKKNVIITGHTRWSALKKLGVTHVHAIVSDMPEDKAHDYRIVDNKTSEVAKWDHEKLLPALRKFKALKRFERHFPELKLPEYSPEVRPENKNSDMPTSSAPSTNKTAGKQVTDEDIAKKEEELKNRFADAAKAFEDKARQITCPHCDESFEIY